ncbi:MAG: RICIN domain-containing protein [Bacteroidaceae bacterium]|nr:RICIN domain-containing protein [Bacteroidaceae bacterium]
MTYTNLSTHLQKALSFVIIFTCFLTAKAELTANGEYYIWLNIYEKLLGSSEDGSEPALSAFSKNSDADSYVFVAEASGKSGYVLLRQKSSGRYLAASSSSSYSVVFESNRSTDDRFCWKVDEGTYTYLINKKNSKYLGVDGANKGSDYVSVYYNKPKGSHSQFSAIPTAGGTWSVARQSYESEVYTNAQGINEIDYCQLKNKSISYSDAIDIHITANDNPLLGTTTINLGSEDTWLIFDNIVPTSVIGNCLKYVTINGKKAKEGTNCRVAIYLNGAAVIPTPKTVMACNGTNGEFTLAVGNHTNLSKQSNSMTSFVLRRGYMATLATGSNGSGYSRVYVADHADLEVTLPTALTKRVTSVNVKEWQYLSKKGWGHLGGSAGTDKLRATWFWTWSADQSSTKDYEYVPCRQHRYWPSKDDVNSHTATAAISLNEPEHSEQHDKCACGGTIDAWTAYQLSPDFLEGGGRIGSPQPTDLSYLTKFCEYVDNNAKRCDFTVTHAYWDLASYDETSYANWFCNTECKSIWNNTGRPVWLTEMEISASWNTNKVSDYEQNRKYLQALLQKMDECPWIERYAIYGTDMWQTYMFYDANTSKGLTPAGQVYRDHRATFAYNSKYTKVPTWWQPSMKSPTLDYSINASANTITFTIGNTNGDATDQLVLQRKVGDNWEDLYSVTNRSQLENEKVTCTLSLDDIDRENDIFRVAATNLYGGEATSEDKGTGFITNPKIVTTSKSEVPGWTCERNALNGYTKAESGDTYFEVWGPTATQMDFNYYQDIKDIPNGVYQLSAACFNATNGEAGASVNGNVGLYAVADGIGYFTPVTTDGELDSNNRLTVDAIIVRNNSIRIGIRNIGQMTARWAGADDFSLSYLGTEEEVLRETYQEVIGSAEQGIINLFPILGNDQRDASGLIANADCSRGTTDRWTVNNLSTSASENNKTPYDNDASNPYFNIWKSGSLNSSLQQTISYLPAGEYQLQALFRGTDGLAITLKAELNRADGTSQTFSQSVTGVGALTIEGSNYPYGWMEATTEPITVKHGDQLTIGAETSSNKTAWWSIDHFRLIFSPLPEEPDVINGTKSRTSTDGTFYTLDGRKTQGKKAPGIYIIRHADGTPRKVLVR